MKSGPDRISIAAEKVKLPLSKNEILKAAEKTLRILKEDDAQLSISFVNDAKMRRLNRKYRNIDRATDCLAFPMREGKGEKLHPRILGDVVISVDTARENSKRFGTTEKRELILYIIHGVLHLLGYSDTTIPAAGKMVKKQEFILKQL